MNKNSKIECFLGFPPKRMAHASNKILKIENDDFIYRKTIKIKRRNKAGVK